MNKAITLRNIISEEMLSKAQVFLKNLSLDFKAKFNTIGDSGAISYHKNEEDAKAYKEFANLEYPMAIHKIEKQKGKWIVDSSQLPK